MTHYETVFILTPVLSDSQVEEAVKKFNDVLTSNGAEIVATENWGLKKLAYPIQNKRNGFYHLVEFKTENTELVSQLEVAYKRDERVIRFLTVKLEKHGIEWAETRRTKLKSNSNK
ncbi:30S ribosomal protein S6 [Faecalibacter rhinopitheci]|uniref:Small ribosomal subunit protein bS6 n=1 Tax=Faecalibacter rhinopitheci TaxID=2779678 RepID=A0A8J7K3Q7_9FLAO|nr:30S ribosomal protein S6 [Faecalibacter rhinopitheci]MBF0596464.1 30S ribosomal protein S6 [Faecalibacter rhinopitheci]MBQ0148148.1 30S ribosomal protein S6 [Candidatus Onthonaster equi]